MMRRSALAMIAVYLLGLFGGMVVTSDAATTFNGSTIVGMDKGKQTITFRTREGKQWTLPVKDPAILDNTQIATGDQVSIEIDLNDTIIKIVTNSDQPPASRPE